MEKAEKVQENIDEKTQKIEFPKAPQKTVSLKWRTKESDKK